MKTPWSNGRWVSFSSLVFWLMILLLFILVIPMEIDTHLMATWDVGSWASFSSLIFWLMILLPSSLAFTVDSVIFLLTSLL
jgi:hypothetical protein